MRVVDPTPEQRAYVALVERWQASLSLDDAGLCRLIGQHKSDWSRFRRFQRPPTALFHARVMRHAGPPLSEELRQAWRAYRDALEEQLAGVGA